ncbi:MAG: monovalent cation/H(+) antiporter subunit G [Opitutales bacterium]
MLEFIANLLLNVFAIGGAVFTLIAAIGLVRFPDFYCRTHAAAKAGAFGGALMALATGIAFGSFKDWVLAFGVICFFYVTTPVASHLLAKAALERNVFFYRKPKAPETSPDQAPGDQPSP